MVIFSATVGMEAFLFLASLGTNIDRRESNGPSVPLFCAPAKASPPFGSVPRGVCRVAPEEGFWKEKNGRGTV